MAKRQLFRRLAEMLNAEWCFGGTASQITAFSGHQHTARGSQQQAQQSQAVLPHHVLVTRYVALRFALL